MRYIHLSSTPTLTIASNLTWAWPSSAPACFPYLWLKYHLPMLQSQVPPPLNQIRIISVFGRTPYPSKKVFVFVFINLNVEFIYKMYCLADNRHQNCQGLQFVDQKSRLSERFCSLVIRIAAWRPKVSPRSLVIWCTERIEIVRHW